MDFLPFLFDFLLKSENPQLEKNFSHNISSTDLFALSYEALVQILRANVMIHVRVRSRMKFIAVAIRW